MTTKRKADVAKWLGVGVALLGVVTAALAWAISVDTNAGKVPHIEAQQDAMSSDLTEIKNDVKWIRERLK